MKRITLVTGGSRSGKSRFALESAMQFQKRVFLATAEITDDEMRKRINRHKDERQNNFVTVEEPLELARAISDIPKEIMPDVQVIVIDCLTVWLGNLLYYKKADSVTKGEELPTDALSFLEVLKAPPCDIIAVTNEVGMGLVPETSLGRSFRDMAGRLNQESAKVADRVVFLVSGIPLIIKEIQ